MKKEDFFEAIGDMDGDIVEQAQKPAKRKRFWTARRLLPLAAAVALAIGVGSWAAGHFRMGSGFNSYVVSFPAKDGHGDGSTVFMSYAGPVFPMTAIEGGEGLKTERALTYDFSPWIKYWWSNEDEANSREDITEDERREVLERYNEWYPEGGQYRSSTDLLVTDGYTLTNPTGEDRAVTLLYPFVSSLRELNELTPVLSADGAELETTLHAGCYSGLQGADGSDSEMLLELARPDSWEQYKALLSDGRYLARALEPWPDLSDTPVIVYKFTDYFGPMANESAPNPSIRACFDLDYDKTIVLSYGFSGASWDRENGKMIQEFSIPRISSACYGEPYYLFVVGDDIQNLTTGGYVTGGIDPDTETLDGCRVEVERYETDLESAMREAAEVMYGSDQLSGKVEKDTDFEMYFGMMKDYLCTYSVLSEDGPERYGTGWLEEPDFALVDCVFYLEAEVTVPAGGSVAVAADFLKHASCDFHCAQTENFDIYGFDAVTKLGTNLSFTEQTAGTVNTEAVEIVRQNYGFDWENGISKVELDLSVEHYYLEVRRVNQE